MTGARTIAQRTDGGIPVITRPVVTGMATGTGRCVGRCRPGYGLAITAVATTAGRIACMRPRVGRTGVRKAQRRPVTAAMTGIALAAGDEMATGLARRLGAIVAVGT